MWRYALLRTALLVAASDGSPNVAKNDNSSTSAVSGSPSFPRPAYSVTDVASYSDTSTSVDSQGPSPSLETSNDPVAGAVSYSHTTTVTVVQIHTPSVYTYVPILSSPDASPDIDPEELSVSIKPSSLTWNAHYSTTSSKIGQYKPSQASYPYKNVTKTSSAETSTSTTVFRGQCTGCALAALNPVTTSYESNLFGNWTSLVVTETVLTEFVTYMNNATIDTVVTETKTVNQTKTVNGITETAAEFNIYLPTPGLDLTLDIGPTYVLYTDLFGGPDAAVQANVTARNNATLKPTQSTCRPHVSSLRGWIPTKTVDWDFFIQTFANGSIPESTPYNSPVPVPDKLQNFLAQDPDLQMHFQGADINTCTLAGISEVLIGDPNRTFNPPAPTSAPAELSAQPTATATTRPAMTSSSPFPTFSSLPGTNTFLSTTYASTSKHITKQGCLRCDTNKGDLPQPKPTPQDPHTDNTKDGPAPNGSPNPKNDNAPKSSDKPNDNNGQKTDGKLQDQSQNTPQSPPKPDIKTTPTIPDFIVSVVSDNPNLTKKPAQQPTDSGQTIRIGDSIVTVKPQPTQQGQMGPDQQTHAPTMVIIGTRTVTVGQTTTINGVPVVVPTAGGGSTIVVGDKTVALRPQITQGPLPVLTVGHSTITANSQGQFVVGTQTLQRGGPLVVIDDNTFTLGPNGKIAIWNGATQTLVSMVGQLAVTFGGESITAKMLGGTTVFVLGDKTLGPGSAVTIDGTTYSLPSGFHGSSIVVNGQTQRLSAGLPALTINNVPITATVADGTTEFVLASGQTLTPGGELVVSGTTYSLPSAGRGSTIVINGATSRLNPSHLPVLPLGSEEATATVARGTTAFVFGPDQTLTPGGVVTVSGTTFSLPASASGSVVVINGVTSTLGSGSGMGPITAASPIVVDGKTIAATTRDGTVEYVLNSATTLLPGGQVIINGTTYSLAPGGTALIVNGKTSSLSTPASNSARTTSSSETTSERGAGDFIASGIGESSKSKGAGSWPRGGGADKWIENLMIGIAGWLLWLV